MRTPILFLAALVAVPRAVGAQWVPLGPEFRVNTYTTFTQWMPAVAAAPSGDFVVVWESVKQDGWYLGVFGQRYASTGEPLGPEFPVNIYTTNNQSYPAVASDSSGNFVVVWGSYGQDGWNYGVFGRRYTSTGVPLGDEFRVNTYTTLVQWSPSVAAAPSGDFVVVWNSFGQDGEEQGVFGQRYASTGEPLGSEFRVNSYTTDFQRYPDVASDSSGNFVVVWSSNTQDHSDDGVFGQRYTSTGVPLGPEFRVNTYTTSTQYRPSVAAASSGDFVVVWYSYGQDGSNWGVFGQRYASAGVPLGPEFPVNTYTANRQSYPAVASDPHGNFVVVWSSFTQDGSYWGVFGRRYTSTGVPLGPEFRVNTYTTHTQIAPAVASDSSGNFVVVWESFPQDGSYSGVFGQRYSQMVPVELMHFRVE